MDVLDVIDSDGFLRECITNRNAVVVPRSASVYIKHDGTVLATTKKELVSAVKARYKELLAQLT